MHQKQDGIMCMSWSRSPILFSWFTLVVRASETEDMSPMGGPNRVALEGSTILAPGRHCTMGSEISGFVQIISDFPCSSVA